MKLVVGLGNPGRKYEGSRHNVGYETLARLAREQGADSPRQRFDGEVCQCSIAGCKTLLIAPRLYYNRSGATVRQAVDFYKAELDDLVVVCDDFNLPVGQIRVRGGGSDGGNNGLADVIRQLGTGGFARLRIGIGPVPQRWDPADFVLGKFHADQRSEMDFQVARAADAVQAWIGQGLDAAMNQFNGRQSAD